MNSTPTITSISPTHGSNETLTVQGSSFGTDPRKIKEFIINKQFLNSHPYILMTVFFSF